MFNDRGYFSGFSKHVVAVVFLFTGGYFGEVRGLVRVVDTLESSK